MLWLSFESVIIYKEKGEQNNTNSHNFVNLKTKTQHEQEEEFEI